MTGQANPYRDVTVPVGSTLMEALVLLVDDIYSNQESLSIAAALRSPTVLSPDSMPELIPSVQFVPYILEEKDSKVVFDMMEVPPEVLFAPRPKDLAVRNAFDNKAKSLVLDPVVLVRNVRTRDLPPGSYSQALYGAPTETALAKKLRQFDQNSGKRMN